MVDCMIDLKIKAEFSNTSLPPFVLRITKDLIQEADDGVTLISANSCEIKFKYPEDILGDILLFSPESGFIHRMIRSGEGTHNSFLLTERCDQVCVMCSQPPKNKDYSGLMSLMKEAILLSDKNITVGISGGEPTLHKEKLLTFLLDIQEKRPDITIHVLTNAQHFTDEDIEPLSKIQNTIWGTPLYSDQATIHDEIVGKEGAFDQLMMNFFRLGRAGSRIELRTVLLAQNYYDLSRLSRFIGKNLKFIEQWSIMGIEPIGYALANKKTIFVDYSIFKEPLLDAIANADALELPTKIFNTPRCCVDPSIRSHTTKSISDWKRKYLPICDTCSEKDECTGFFEWTNEEWIPSEVRPITSFDSQQS